jgi:hypothetical protein
MAVHNVSWHSCGGIGGGTLRHLQLIKDNITKDYISYFVQIHTVTHVWYVERRNSDDLSGLGSPGFPFRRP